MRAQVLAVALGRAVRDARRRERLTQTRVGEAANVAQSTVSKIERGHGTCISLLVWSRVARAAGSDLRAYLDAASAAEQPRDAVHLGYQELIIRTATNGGWSAFPEMAIDATPERSRAVDVLLRRGPEHALLEVWDWFDDVGAALRGWDRRFARIEMNAVARMPVDGAETPRVAGCWVVRATVRNRNLVGGHAALFGARFPGSARAWLSALESARPMPDAPALLWANVRGDRLVAARLHVETGGRARGRG